MNIVVIVGGNTQLVTHLDNLCIDHWLFVMIIQLVVATPYTQRNFLFASPEGRIDQFLPFFFLNIPFIHVTRPQKNCGVHSIIFQPQNGPFFPEGGANLVTFSKWQAESQNGGQEGCCNDDIRYALKKKIRHYLGIFPNMGGGLPKSQNFCKFTKYFFVCQIHSEVLKHVLQRGGGDI